MYDYVFDGVLGGNRTVWSQVPVQPLAPCPLTPFSYSVLAEIFSRAWFRYYDRLGFDPTPRARVVRQHQGWLYANLTAAAQLEAEHAGLEPLTLRVNDDAFPVCPWEKPGRWAGWKRGRTQKRIDELVDQLAADVEVITSRARTWCAKTHELRWTQAEVLQVMEEIERVSLDSFVLFFAARHQLEWVYNRLIRLTAGAAPFPATLNLINDAIGGSADLVEADIARQILSLADLVRTDARTLEWLRAVAAGQKQEPPARDDLLVAWDNFLVQYGHRTTVEGELSTRRWSDEPAAVASAILACAENAPRQPTPRQAEQSQGRLVAAAGDKRRHEVETLVVTGRRAMDLQSKALHAVAYILTGTRHWASAAGREAAADRRLANVEDVFFFELEEMKEMMTGEWNISAIDEIHAAAARRKAEHAAWRQSAPGEVLIGDVELYPARCGLPGSAGQVAGLLQRWEMLPQDCNGAVVGVSQLDSGWSIVLPLAQGFVTAQGTPLDPIVAATRLWRTPTLLALGRRYDLLVEGAPTTVDVDKIAIEQS